MAVAILAMFGRFWMTYAMNTSAEFCTEMFPTELRCQGLAVATVLASVAVTASPYIVSSVKLNVS